MNSQELQKRLSPASGTLTLSLDSLGKSFGDFLTAYYGGNPLIITQAASKANGDGSVLVSGRSTFASVADLPVTARFSLDGAGEVMAELRYVLRDEAPGPAAWTFSRSFPKLPAVYDYTLRTDHQLLGSLDLFDTYFVVRTHPGEDPDRKAPLFAGINFLSKLRPTGLLGLFEHAEASNPTLMLHGVVHYGKPGDLTVALRPLERPWDRLKDEKGAPLAPGIYLSASLDLGFRAGKLALGDTQVHIYSPFSDDFWDENPDFGPTLGYSGALSIPSAGISVDLSSYMERGIAQTLLVGDVHGVSIAKLEHLLDIAGSGDLSNHLPSELKKLVEGLEKLELMQVALDIILEDGLPAVRAAIVTIGFPNLSWKIYKDDVIIESLACKFVVFDPFGALSAGATSKNKSPRPMFRPSIGVAVTGVVDIEGAPLSVTVSSDTKFSMVAYTPEAVSLPIDKLLHRFGPNISAPKGLTLNTFELFLGSDKTLGVDAVLASTGTEWTVTVGKEKMAISNVSFRLNKPSEGQTTGHLGGTIEFDENVSLTISYDLPGKLLLRSHLRRFTLSGLIDKLCNKNVPFPKGFDITLLNSWIIIQESDDKALFQLMTEVEGLGVLAFEASNMSGTAGFSFGLDLSATTPSKVPGLAAIAAIEKMLHLERFMLVVSSIDSPGLQLPDGAAFGNPTLATKKVSLPGSGGVTAGVNVFADWVLGTSNKHEKLLAQLLGLSGTLEVAVSIPPNPLSSRLFVKRSGKLAGHPFMYEVGVLLDDGVPGFFLTGDVTVSIHKSPVTFDVTTLFVETGMFMSASMKDPAPINCGPFKIADLALEVGVDWIGIPSLGIAGTIDAKNFESSIAVFFDSANPMQSMIAGSVSNLTLKDVVDTMLGGKRRSSIDKVLSQVSIKGTHEFKIDGGLASALDSGDLAKVAAAFNTQGKVTIPASSDQALLVVNKKGEAWHLTDLTKMLHYSLSKRGNDIIASLEAQFYFAPMATAIGAIQFPAGYFLNAAVDFFGFKVSATIDIRMNQGISVDAEMDKIVIGGEHLFCIRAADGKGGPKLSISTFSQPDEKDPELRKPHLYINGAAELLGLKASVLAKIDTSGMTLLLKGPLAPGVEFDLDVKFGHGELEVDGDIKVGVGTINLGKLGKIKVNTDVEGSLGVRVNAKQIEVRVEASFEFLGNKIKIGRFNLATTPGSLAKLAKTIEEKVAHEIESLFKDVEHWTAALGKGLVEGVEHPEKVLKDVYKKTDEEAKKIVKGIGKGTEVIGKDIGKGAQIVGKGVGKGAQVVGKGVGKGAKVVGKEAGKDAKNIGKGVGKDVKNVGKGVGKDVKNVGKGLGKFGKKLKKLF